MGTNLHTISLLFNGEIKMMKNELFKKGLAVALTLIVALTAIIVPINLFSADADKIEDMIIGGVYQSGIDSIAGLETDGWKASYSSDPQSGVAFTAANMSDLFKTEDTTTYLIREDYNETYFSGKNHSQDATSSYNYYQYPFQRMAAITYGEKWYKYFKLEIDYMMLGPGSPWPIVSFGQQSSETASIFYAPVTDKNNPTGHSNNVIGVYPEVEGSINIKGNAVTPLRKDATHFPSSGWDTNVRHLTITVLPGSVTVQIADKDPVTTPLNDNYIGGYIALMAGCTYSNFNNIKITELIDPDETYVSSLGDAKSAKAQGWKASYSADPQRGTAFTAVEIEDVFKLSGGDTGFMVREENGNFDYSKGGNWKDPFRQTAALTYTTRKYKYFELEVDYQVSDNGTPWPAVTFGQPNADTASMFYFTTPDISEPTGHNDNVTAVYAETEGKVLIRGKRVAAGGFEPAAEKAFPSTAESKNTWRHMTLTVEKGSVTVEIDGLDPVSTALDSNYTEGYISLMLACSYSKFKNIKITELQEKLGYYANSLASLDMMAAEGWKASYSEDPQNGVPFTAEELDVHFKNENSGIIKNEVGFNWSGNESYNNWKDPFHKMGALTYGAQKYKYFKLEVDYMMGDPGVPYPLITFGQPNADVAKMVYKVTNAISDPKGHDDAVIGVYPEAEGNIFIAGKNVSSVKKEVSEDKKFESDATGRNTWRHMTITVIPGSVIVEIEGQEPVSTSLNSTYDGGYIALMIGHSYARYKNFEVTDYEHIDLSQQSEVSLESKIDLKRSEHRRPILFTTKAVNKYALASITATEKDTTSIPVNEVAKNVYAIDTIKSDTTVVATYEVSLYYENALANFEALEEEGWISTYQKKYGEGSIETLTGDNFGKYWRVDGWLIRTLNKAAEEGILDTKTGNRDFTGAQPRTEQIAAMTYGVAKYKDFELDLEMNNSNYPDKVRPVIVFGAAHAGSIQYSKADNMGDNDAIGVHIDKNGYVHVEGKYVENGEVVFPGTFNSGIQKYKIIVQNNLLIVFINGEVIGTTILTSGYKEGYISLVSASTYGYFKNIAITDLNIKDNQSLEITSMDYDEKITLELAKTEAPLSLPKALKVPCNDGKSYWTLVEWKYPTNYKANIAGEFDFIGIAKPELSGIKNTGNHTAKVTAKQVIDYDPDKQIKYYFNSVDELKDFDAYRSPHALNQAVVKQGSPTDRWTVTGGKLVRTIIDNSDATTKNWWSDYNLLTLRDHKFRNFELTIEYEYGSSQGYPGIIFAQEDLTKLFDTEDQTGGIFAYCEKEGKPIIKGQSIYNPNNGTSVYPWEPWIDDYTNVNVKTIRLRVVEGIAQLWINENELPITAIIAPDSEGYISIGSVNGQQLFNNLVIKPLDEFGNEITLAENAEILKTEWTKKDIESDIWNGDNSDWGSQPKAYVYDKVPEAGVIKDNELEYID